MSDQPTNSVNPKIYKGNTTLAGKFHRLMTGELSASNPSLSRFIATGKISARDGTDLKSPALDNKVAEYEFQIWDCVIARVAHHATKQTLKRRFGPRDDASHPDGRGALAYFETIGTIREDVEADAIEEKLEALIRTGIKAPNVASFDALEEEMNNILLTLPDARAPDLAKQARSLARACSTQLGDKFDTISGTGWKTDPVMTAALLRKALIQTETRRQIDADRAGELALQRRAPASSRRARSDAPV